MLSRSSGAVGILAPARSPADLLYGTDLANGKIVTIDTDTNAVTTLVNVPNPDTLVFDLGGRIIYSAYLAGQVRRYDPATGTDVLVAGGFNRPVDLALEPGGNSVLVAEQAGRKIDRINLVTNAVSLLRTTSGSTNGLTYDNSGRLFATISLSTFAELNPTTGAVLHSVTVPNDIDGVTFDSVTGLLYAASQGSSRIFSFNPNSLASGETLLTAVPGPDGIVSDGKGNLYIAARGDFHVYRYNFASRSLIRGASVPGLDDLAPASGLGSIPEPGSLVLLGTGALGLLGHSWYRRRVARARTSLSSLLGGTRDASP